MTLKNYEKKSLIEGNTYAFAHLVLQHYESICKDAEFSFHDAVNYYRARTDYNNGIFTLYGKNLMKYHFDSEMNFRGITE